MKLHSLLVLNLLLFSSGCISPVEENSSVPPAQDPSTPDSPIQEGELELLLSPDILHAKKDETFYINLSLKNTGNNTLNVIDMEEHFSYNIKYANGSSINYLTLPGVLPPYDDTIVPLDPGESLNVTADSRSWYFSEGEHIIKAIYFIKYDGDLTKPHWKGTVYSNNITLFIE
jgi:hypothetical protein